MTAKSLLREMFTAPNEDLKKEREREKRSKINNESSQLSKVEKEK